MVGGGALHSVEVVRMSAYYAAGKTEGVLEPNDLFVAELDVPGAQVRVMPGAAAIKNRTPGYDREMYLMLAKSETVVDIAATGSGSGRSDLIVAIVKDPYVSGSPWDEPVDPTVGPYVEPMVISNVDDTTTTVTELGLGYSAVPLARIDIPESTGTITQDMITDLRGVDGDVPVSGGQRTRRVLRTYALTEAETEVLSTANTAGNYWPDPGSWNIPIPEWAVQAHIIAMAVQARAPATQAIGRLWVGIGITEDQNQLTTQEIRFDTPAAGVTRQTFVVADDVNIPANMRGVTKRIGLRGYAETEDSYVQLDWGSAVTLDIEFRESPATDQAG